MLSHLSGFGTNQMLTRGIRVHCGNRVFTVRSPNAVDCQGDSLFVQLRELIDVAVVR
jgi:hypothetical protein